MLTVLLATRNGGETLAAVLEAYCHIQVPAGGYKVVVVDNGSTDSTPTLEARFRSRLPLTWLTRTKPGKNAALNRGLEAVEGDLVVLTDDDAFPRPDLLAQMRRAADINPEFAIFGGAVIARWAVEPPEWVVRWVPPGPAFTITPASLRTGPTDAHSIFGPNMAVRAELFAAGHRFDTSIGPRGANYAMGSETEFVRRMVAQGHRAWHVAEAVVEHLIRATQLNPSWIWQRATRFGRGQFRLSEASALPHTAYWFGTPRYLWLKLMQQSLSLVWAHLRMDREQMVLARWQFNYLLGQAQEARAMRSGRTGAA